MIDDLYQSALSTLEHHLDEAGMPYTVDDGELLVGDHRIGLSISFEGIVPQGNQMLAPLDIQIHVDGDSGDRFRVGTLGVGSDAPKAIQDGIAEWHTLAVWPLLSALGADVETRRAPGRPQQLAGWDLFPGRVGIRGKVPAGLAAGGPFYRALLERLKPVVAKWEQPHRFTLHSIFIMATCSSAAEVQAAVDGLVDEELVALLQNLPWPTGSDTYLYKQLFVLRHDGEQ
jgi:hypothetical protein